ncbi:MAG: SRPBCC domain-containing protein [Paracoccaceae bacterium]
MIGLGIPGLNIRLEVAFPAPPDRVFAALTDELDAWWPVSLRRLQGRMSLEARLGSDMVEIGPNGEGTCWARVDCRVPGRNLHLSGHFCVDNVVAGRILYDLAETPDGGCRLTLTHLAIGPVSVDHALNRRKQWSETLEGPLRRHLAG